MAAGGRRRRPLRYQSLAALVEDSQWPFLFLVSDFSYGADDYDGEGNEEQKGPPEGSETMPYIDESPTMSPQLSARNQGGGDSISPTPPEGLAPGVGIPALLSGEKEAFREGKAGMGVVGQALFRILPGEQDWGNLGLPVLGALVFSFQSRAPQRRLLSHPTCCSLCLFSQPSARLPAGHPPLRLSAPLAEGTLGKEQALLSGPGWAVAACVTCGLCVYRCQFRSQGWCSTVERTASLPFFEDQEPCPALLC